MAKELDRKLSDYVDRFHENLPLFQMPSMSDEEVIKIIDGCLASGKPYKCDASDDQSVKY